MSTPHLFRFSRVGLWTVYLPVITAMTVTPARGEPAATKPTGVITLDGPQWLLAPDPKDVGRQEKWWEKPTAEAKAAKIPWIVQDAFPDS